MLSRPLSGDGSVVVVVAVLCVVDVVVVGKMVVVLEIVILLLKGVLGQEEPEAVRLSVSPILS